MNFKRLTGRVLHGCRRRAVMAHSRFSRRPIRPGPNRALEWLLEDCLGEAWVDPALVSTLVAYGERRVAFAQGSVEDP